MKSFKSTLLAISLGIMGFVVISISANEIEERNIIIEIKKTNAEDAVVNLNVNGDLQVFAIPDLDVGETQEIVTESGSVVVISKDENGITVMTDGEEILLPSVNGDLSAHLSTGPSQLHTIKDGIQVIGDLTDEQIAIVRDAFAAAGVDKDISFSKGNEMQFFSIDGNGTTIDINGINGDQGNWITDKGEHKIIKINTNQQGVHMEKRIIIITDEETEEN